MDNKAIFKEAIKTWSPFAITILVILILASVIVQQNYRTLANDPQIQIAEDIAGAIETGTPADAIAPVKGNTDIKKSLAPFVLIYNANGTQIGSSAIYNEQNPEFPKTALDKITESGKTYKLTWEPEKNVRIATVIKKYSSENGSGYVIAGRSLRETDARILQNLILISIVCLAGLITSLLVIFFIKKSEHKKTAQIIEQ